MPGEILRCAQDDRLISTVPLLFNKYPEDIVEAAMMANMHHGLPIQRFKVTEHVLWLYGNDYEVNQIAEITELTIKEVRRIIARFESESEIVGNTVEAKSDGQLLLDYLTRLHKRVSDTASVAHEMVVAMNEASEQKQDEYIASIQFLSAILRRIKIG